MDDLISRQAAIDALENDKAALDKIIKGMSAEDMLLKYYVAQHNQVSYDIDAIVQLPPIQPKPLQPWEVLVAQTVLPQPEIVRCKDCKWYGRADKRRFYRGMDCLQKRIDTIVPDKDFCSRAERRTDG